MEEIQHGTTQDYQNREGSPDGETEEVERRLAAYAFVREERDREVRLMFRDVPALELAIAFRAAGATLLSVSGERATAAMQAAEAAESQPPASDEPSQPPSPRRRRSKATSGEGQPLPAGEVVVRYFFALRETVYTVSVAVPSGVPGSIAGVYPGARLPERELQSRLGVVFTRS